MEFLIALVILAVIGFPILLLFGVIGVGAAANKKTKQDRADAPNILDGSFDGRETVAYRRSTLAGLSAQEVIDGAAERGYAFVSASPDGKYGETMVFRKAAEGGGVSDRAPGQ